MGVMPDGSKLTVAIKAERKGKGKGQGDEGGAPAAKDGDNFDAGQAKGVPGDELSAFSVALASAQRAPGQGADGHDFAASLAEAQRLSAMSAVSSLDGVAP